MSLKREEHPCWLVVCDHCGEGDDTEYGGSFHHQSEEGAREAAHEVEMEVSATGAVLCLTCIEECWMIVGCPRCTCRSTTNARIPTVATPASLATSVSRRRWRRSRSPMTGHPFQSEADFQRAVTDLATRAGWRWWHWPESRRTNAASQTYSPPRPGVPVPGS